MKLLTDTALNAAEVKGATYADIRIINSQSQSLAIKNGQVEDITAGKSSGFGVRVILNGSWGFASSNKLDENEIERVATLACDIATASSKLKIKDIELSTAPKIEADYISPVITDPFRISIEDKIAHLQKAESLIRKNKAIKVSTAHMGFYKTNKTFASTQGSYINQEIIESGAGIDAIAVRDGMVQNRSYPNSHSGNFATRGYEFIESLELEANAQRIAEEAEALLTADVCPTMDTDIILSGNQLALQIHESLGHPAELDRVLGMETSYAGTSFLTLDKLGKYRYGSDKVNIYADATIPGALGSFGYDDEGVPAQSFDLVKEGILVDYLTSRETAPVIGKDSNGTMRADGWQNLPLVRMTNISLKPGDYSLEELIADTKEGVLLDTNKSWSIDDKRLNFQFATEIGWLIKNGKKVKMLRDCNYHGITPVFWNNLDAICGQEEWIVWGVPNCGKGEPSQIAHVGHGASPARFMNVKVGVKP
ncbi:MAG: TldD/PmbA family protein [Actinobacteria bacterium]|nr:MAG: TldD/PmbA family protein [Actinomycetota bacterium]